MLERMGAWDGEAGMEEEEEGPGVDTGELKLEDEGEVLMLPLACRLS